MPGHTCRDQGTTVWGVYMPWHTEQSKVCCTHMPRHTFSDHRTTVWGVYMPRHTQSSQRTTMWGTYIPRHTLRGQRATGGVERAHTRAYMQDQDHFLEPAHARAHTQRSEDLYKSKFSLLTLWVGPRGDTEI